MTDRWTIERYDHGEPGRQLIVRDTTEAETWAFAALWSHDEEANLRALVGAANRTHTAEARLAEIVGSTVWRAIGVREYGCDWCRTYLPDDGTVRFAGHDERWAAVVHGDDCPVTVATGTVAS